MFSILDPRMYMKHGVLMPIKISILENNSKVEISSEKIKVKELLEHLGLSISENLVLRRGAILTEEDEVVDGDEVVIYTVKSGG